MSTITIPTFAGEIPKIDTRLLETQNASVAINCVFERGSLQPLHGPGFVESTDSAAKTIFKHPVDGWLSWEKKTHVVRSAVLDIEDETPMGHLLITGDRDYPTQYLAGGEMHRLGIPRPAAPPSLSADTDAVFNTTTVQGYSSASLADSLSRYGDGGVEVQDGVNADIEPFSAVSLSGDSGDSKIIRSSSYCYTYVQSLAGGAIQQESAPSAPTEIIDVETDDGVALSGFVFPDLEGLTITHVRIYRAVAGLESSEFRFVAEVAVPDLLASGKYVDTLQDKDISSEVLQTSIWDSIPDDAQGLIKTDNGIYAAFRGNELLVSEPFIPYAFPETYRLTVESRIIALAHVDSTIVVLTSGRPYLAYGGVPESLQLVHLPIEQSCVSADSVATMAGAVIYASPDGLMLFSSGEQALATSGVFTRAQWQDMGPEKLMGTVIDGRYIAFFSGTNRGIIFDIGRSDISRIALPEEWAVNCLYHHSEDDCAYLAIETPEGHGIWQFEGGEALQYRWRSKEFFTSSLIGMSTARISGEQRPGNRVILDIYGPDSKRKRGRLSLNSDKAVRIPPMRSERLWSVEVSGKAVIHEVRLSSGVEALECGY